MDVTINQIRGAKGLRFEIVDEKGIVWARVISLPIAEKFVPIIEESKKNADDALSKLVLG